MGHIQHFCERVKEELAQHPGACCFRCDDRDQKIAGFLVQYVDEETREWVAVKKEVSLEVLKLWMEIAEFRGEIERTLAGHFKTSEGREKIAASLEHAARLRSDHRFGRIINDEPGPDYEYWEYAINQPRPRPLIPSSLGPKDPLPTLWEHLED